MNAFRAGQALLRHFLELRFQPPRRERRASQTAAAERAAAERQVDAGVLKARQNRLLDLIERQRTSGHPMRQPLERTWNLADAVRRVLRRSLGYRVVIDDRLQDDRVVSVQPERELLVARCRLDRHAGQRPDVGVEFRALELERSIIDEAIANVRVENFIVRLSRRRPWLTSEQRRRDGEPERAKNDDAAPGRSRINATA